MRLSLCAAGALLTVVMLSFMGCQGVLHRGPSQLTVSDTGSGVGTVTSTPAGINCPGTCSASFSPGTTVVLTATPAAKTSFDGWSGACFGTEPCTLTLNANAFVNASFTGPPPVRLSISFAGRGTGLVTSNPAGISCPKHCSGHFPTGSQVKLTAAPGTGFAFGGWSGACVSTATTCIVTMNAASTVTASFGGSLQTSLNHIIVFLQENRSFDSYFGAMRAYWAQNGFPDQSFDGLPQFNPSSGAAPLQGPAPSVPGCDPAKPFPADLYCHASPGNSVTSYHSASVCQEELSPFWNESHTDWNYRHPEGNTPLLNGFVIAGANDARQYNNPGPANDVNGLRVMGYFDWTDLNYYYFMASSFATSDRWFSPVMDRTQISRMYLLAATSAGQVYPLHSGPQLTATTIIEELQNAGISWKIYEDPQGSPCASNPTGQCLERLSYINQFTYGNRIAQSPTLSQNIVPIAQYTIDLQNGSLPQVALIEPASTAGLDEHPTDVDSQGGVDIQAGANFAAGIINGLMNSSSWKDSVLIFSYDEFGGFYDHVPPQPMPSPDGIPPMGLQPGDACDSTTGPLCDFTWTGYRVPLIVISPFAKKSFVSHQVRDYTAILKLIESRFGLPALTKRDAAQADMGEFFDFVNVPWATPPSPPTQVRTGKCSLAAPAP